MPLPDKISAHLDTLIEDLLQLEGDAALDTILAVSSYFLHWTGHKLKTEDLSDLAAEYFETAKRFEELLALRDDRTRSGKYLI